MKLISEISRLTQLPADAEHFLRSNSQQLELKRGDVLLEFDDICNYMYFIDQGFLRGYYYLDGKEITSWFSQENEFATCFYAFISRKPSVETIQALENSLITRISYNTLQSVYDQFPETERIGRILTEAYYLKLEERFLNIQFKSAKERYQNLLEAKPDYLQRASLGQIASYLGVSQETLSRMRASI